MLNTFFKDLKVIELASVLAGPAIGMFFAELGAQVVKVENKKTGGDVTRKWKLPSEDKTKSYSAYYFSINWNKETHFLNLAIDEDRQIVYNWIREADIVISNFKPASAKKMKMDYETLKGINSTLIYAHLSSFEKGLDRPAFDVVLQAEAGFLHMCGEYDREPVKMPVALIDILAAHQLKEAILLALLKLEKTGEGSYVETSLVETAIASLANQASNWLNTGFIPQRMGSLHPNIAPYGEMFYTKDQKAIVLAIGTDKQFAQLCKVLDLKNIITDVRFSTNVNRVIHREELKTILSKQIDDFSRKELMKQFQTAGIPAGSIRNMQEVFDLEVAQKMILEEQLSDGTISQRVKTIAFQME